MIIEIAGTPNLLRAAMIKKRLGNMLGAVFEYYALRKYFIYALNTDNDEVRYA